MELPPIILIVEDDDQLRELLCGALRREFRHVEVHGAQTGQAAIAAMETTLNAGRELALVVSDLVMPGGMDGIELLAEVGVRAPLCGKVLLTGQGGMESAVAALRLGLDDYLQKPFREEELIRILGGHLKRRELVRRTAELERALIGSWRSVAHLVAAVQAEADPHLVAVLRGDGVGAEHRAGLLKARRTLNLVAEAYSYLQPVGGARGRQPEPLSLRELASSVIRSTTAELNLAPEGVAVYEPRTPPQALAVPEIARIALAHLLENALRTGTGRADVVLLGEGRNWPDEVGPDDLPAVVRDALSLGHVGISIRNTAALTREDEQYVWQVLEDRLPVDQPLRGLGLPVACLYARLLGGQIIFQWRPARSQIVFTLLLPRGDTGAEGRPEHWGDASSS